MSTTHPTAKEIFDQLVALQKEMAEEDAKREKLCDALSTIPEEVDDEIREEMVANICDVFGTRDIKQIKLIELYEKMYTESLKK